MTTVWSHNLRPSTLRHCTSRPSTAPLNRQYMYAMGRVVHVLVVQLILSLLISLLPKVELSRLRWSDFDQLRSSGRFLTWVQGTTLTNLAIDIFTLPT